MSEFIGVGSAYKTCSAQYIGVGGFWKTIANKWIGVGGVWKQSFADLTVAISPSAVATSADSATVSAVISGGSAPYTYLWSWASGGAGITINSPTASSTLLQDGPTPNASGTLRLTVTDANGTSKSDTASILLRFT